MVSLAVLGTCNLEKLKKQNAAIWLASTQICIEDFNQSVPGKSVRYKEVSAIKDVRYREVLLYMECFRVE